MNTVTDKSYCIVDLTKDSIVDEVKDIKLSGLLEPDVAALLPASFYGLETLVLDEAVEFVDIPVCQNECFLFYQGDATRDTCPSCQEPRLDPHGNVLCRCLTHNSATYAFVSSSLCFWFF
jgi:hypothetical protein